MQRSLKLSEASWLLWPETKALIQAFGTTPLRFVGGAVRDSLLGKPVKDVDVATILLPDDVMKLLAVTHIKAVPTGIDHGTVTAVIAGHHFEITTLRRDISTDGRRAVVAYTQDWQQDASRRDFTMNALYCDADGQVTDYFNGAEDAKKGHVRFIGEPAERIHEDALRILRFFRFLACYGHHDPDKKALLACAAAVGKIDRLSGERIQQEMFKLLVSEKAAYALKIMQDHGILKHIIPDKLPFKSLQNLPELLHKTDQTSDPILGLALLLRSSSVVAQLVAVRWKLSRSHTQQLSDLCIKRHALSGNEKALKKKIRALGKESFIQHVLLEVAEGEDVKTGIAAIKLAADWDIPGRGPLR